jgi:hypothetical protein
MSQERLAIPYSMRLFEASEQFVSRKFFLMLDFAPRIMQEKMILIKSGSPED